MEEKIDYLTVTCEDCTTDRLVKEFHQIPKTENLLKVAKDEEDEEMEVVGTFKRISPHYRNHQHWFFGAGVATELNAGESGNHNMLVNFGGKGMDVFRSFEYSDLEIFKKLKSIGFKATRIDYSIDFYDDKKWELIRKAIKQKKYATKSKSMAILADPIKGEIETIYIGSQKSREILLCMYDKRKEQNKRIVERNRKEGRHDRLIRFPWYRIEIRVYNGSKSKTASSIFDELCKLDVEIEFYKFLRERVSRFFRFLQEEPEGLVFSPEKNAWGTYEGKKFKRYPNPGRWKTADWWLDIVGEAGEKMTYVNPKVNDFETYVDTMNIQCSKRIIKRFLADMGPMERDMIKNIKDPDDKKNVLAAMISNRSHIIMDLIDYGVENWKKEDQDFVDQVLIPSKKVSHPTPFLKGTAHEK